MDLDYISHVPENFLPESRVWVYQCDRLLRISEALELEEMFEKFIPAWNSHGTPVKGFANLFFGKFIVFIADEKASKVSGCSTDSSVALVRKAEKLFKVNFFDRQILNFIVKDKIEAIPLSQFSYAIQNGHLQPGTLYFNNTVLNLEDWRKNWIIPIDQSWLAAKMPVV
ncbi:MAG: hypothetical protein ABIT96_12720 [Ferruginibacter sp.]